MAIKAIGVFIIVAQCLLVWGYIQWLGEMQWDPGWFDFFRMQVHGLTVFSGTMVAMMLFKGMMDANPEDYNADS